MEQITHATAERLRGSMSDIQLRILNSRTIPSAEAAALVNEISKQCIRLVDQLEGVIR